MIIPTGKKYFYFFIFTGPALFVTILFLLFPFFTGVYYAFTDLNGNGIKPARFIGLQNFREMCDPQIDRNFMPRAETRFLFRNNYELPLTIEALLYKNMLIKHIKGQEELALLRYAYPVQDGKTYTLNENLNEFSLFDTLLAIPGMDYENSADILEQIKRAAFDGKVLEAELSKKMKALNPEQQVALMELADRYYTVFKVKKMLSAYLYKKEISPGVLGFTLLYAVLNLIFANLGGLLLALDLDRKRQLCKVLRTVFFLPNALSLITLSFIWSLMFDKILPAATGIEVWLSDPQTAPFLVSFIGIWRGCGYLMLIYLAGLQLIPREQLEAAALDGANRQQQFFKITAPLLWPAFAAGTIWSLADALKVFDLIFGLTGSAGYAPNNTPLVLDLYIDAFTGSRFGYAAAKAFLLFLVIAVLTVIQLGIMKKKEFEP